MEKQARADQEMPECFGISFGWFDDFGTSEHEDREKCFHCPQFEPCWKMSMVRSLHNLRYEMRRGVRGLRNSLGGSHSENPFG
ncbi:hypothetical protein JXA32_03225 [Candidatus Sumerlaeota bacterium]|nr:hypothetical protein [Candidatus Sumerlaeota bacterium]